jgi:DnaD/phage-associated family protein
VFTIYNDSGSDSTMVSNLFIDEYMKSANDAQIKVYLYLLRMMGTHRAASVSDMADQFNHTEKDVVRSLRYWERKGLLNLDFDSRNTLISIRMRRPGTVPDSTYGSSVSDANRVLAFSQPAAVLLPDSARENACLRMAAGGIYPARASLSAGSFPESDQGGSPEAAPSFAQSMVSSADSMASFAESTAFSAETTGAYPEDLSGSGKNHASSPASAPSELEALEGFRSDPGRKQLLFVIEQYIGKPMSLNEIRIIYHISERLHFSDDMIDYLLQYCVDRGKKDFRYIKKVAENWAESGISTPLQAEQAAAGKTVPSRKKKAKGAGSGSGSADSEAGEAAYMLRQEIVPSASRPAEKKQGRAGKQARSSNSFNQFEQNDYDFDQLEKELLGS